MADRGERKKKGREGEREGGGALFLPLISSHSLLCPFFSCRACQQLWHEERIV